MIQFTITIKQDGGSLQFSVKGETPDHFATDAEIDMADQVSAKLQELKTPDCVQTKTPMRMVTTEFRKK